MSSKPVPVAKRAHKKSRFGCQQCKLRKVKCDERRPLCRNCEKHYDGLNECDFQAPQSAPSRARQKYPTPAYTPPKAPIRKIDALRQPPIPQLLASLGPGMDPFMVHPDSKVPEAQFLMHHYFSTFPSKTFPIVLDHEKKPLVASWWDWAGQDAVLFHATIQLSALHLAGLRGEENDTHSKFLLNKECIRLLRERVEDPVLSVSNETMGSILFLIIIEFERGNMKRVRMHVEGLKRMVKIRGGVNAIAATNGILANMIFGVSWTVMTEPQFEPEPVDPRVFDRWGEVAQDDPRLTQLEEYGVAKSYARLMREVVYCCAILTGEEIGIKPTTNYCSDMLSRLMYLKPPEEGPSKYISEAARIATGMACLFPFHNDYPNPRLMINVQLHKLKAALESIMELISPSSHEYGLLPWLLGVGGICAIEPERSWFVSELITVAEDLNIRTYEEYKPHCVKILWVEAFCDWAFNKLWDEAATKRDKLNLVDSW